MLDRDDEQLLSTFFLYFRLMLLLQNAEILAQTRATELVHLRLSSLLTMAAG